MSKRKCPGCKEFFEIDKTRKYQKTFCSRSCSNKREHSEETKNKISNKLKKDLMYFTCINEKCNCQFTSSNQKAKFCSRSCSNNSLQQKESGRKYGLISASLQSETRRSKNEILFYNLCKNKFKKVLHNKRMFNGWDADIIIEDFKMAVLWNGKWHYEKITKKHSLKQVQTRDNIKIKEIIKCGYTPYIIKDLGKFNKSFVEYEFNKFIGDM